MFAELINCFKYCLRYLESVPLRYLLKNEPKLNVPLQYLTSLSFSLSLYPFSLPHRGHPAHLTEDISPESAGGNADESEHYDEQSVIVQLSARVQDGTRCRSGSLDMCIQGKCQVSYQCYRCNHNVCTTTCIVCVCVFGCVSEAC